MATNGQKNTGTVYDSYFWVKWSQASQDIANNKTTINWSCGVYCGHNFYLNAVKMSAVTINGTQVYSGGTYSNLNRLTTYTLGSGTLDIPHNSDGTKTFTISAFTGWTYSSNNYSASASSYTLDTIPRKATVSAGTDFTDEGNPVITFSNPAGFDVVPFLYFYNSAGTYIGGVSRSKGRYSSPYTFSLTDAERTNLLKLMTSQKSYTVREGVITYNGSTSLGSSYVNKTMTIVNATPDFSTIDAYDTNSAIVDITGNNHTLILGKSTLGITWSNASAKKSATITSYRVEWQNQSQSYAPSVSNPVSLNITASGSHKLKITAIDSRGYTKSVEKTITILPYSNPNGIVAYGRVNNYEDETHLKIDGSFTSVKVGGTEKNSMTIQWRWRKNISGQGWSSWITVDDNVDYTYSFPKESEYIFNCKVTDVFGSVWEKEYLLAKGKFPLYIDTGMNAVGINEFPKEGDALRVSGGTSKLSGGGTINHQFASDVLKFALSCEQGLTPFNTGGTTTNIPNSEYAYSVGTVHRRIDDQCTVILYAYNSSKIAMNTYMSGWKGWTIFESPSDYVVEQGTSGVWTYQKWNSGKIETWGNVKANFPASTQLATYRHRSIYTVSLNTLMIEIVGGSCPYNYSGLFPHVMRNGTTKSKLELMIVDAQSFAGFSATVPVHVVGRWK